MVEKPDPLGTLLAFAGGLIVGAVVFFFSAVVVVWVMTVINHSASPMIAVYVVAALLGALAGAQGILRPGLSDATRAFWIGTALALLGFWALCTTMRMT